MALIVCRRGGLDVSRDWWYAGHVWSSLARRILVFCWTNRKMRLCAQILSINTCWHFPNCSCSWKGLSIKNRKALSLWRWKKNVFNSFIIAHPLFVSDLDTRLLGKDHTILLNYYAQFYPLKLSKQWVNGLFAIICGRTVSFPLCDVLPYTHKNTHKQANGYLSICFFCTHVDGYLNKLLKALFTFSACVALDL